MKPLETPAEFRTAFDFLLERTQRQMRLYDHDLSLFEIDHLPRHNCLRALCVAAGGRRIELLLDETGEVARDHPRLMQLVRDFGHVLEIRQADPELARPDKAFILADRNAILVRADKVVLRGILHLDDVPAATLLNQEFDAMWQRSQSRVTATPLGL